MNQTHVDMLSLRSFTLVSTSGHSVEFKARERTSVPRILVQEAMAAGCGVADEDDLPFINDQAKAKVEFTGDIRKSLMYMVMDVIANDNDTKNFTAAGRPKVDVVADRLGFDVSAQEVQAAWNDYQGAKVLGKTPQLHQDAEDVMAVIQCEEIAELRAIGRRFNYNDDQMGGMTTRDLRKMLLSKFSGIPLG